MGNRALDINGFTNTVHTNNHITTRGSDWYFTVCAVMIVSTGAFMGLAFTKPRPARLFHYITASITMVAAVAYFSMGSNLGWTAIEVEWFRSDPKVAGHMRQIFYVRYIDQFITTPLVLLDLLLTCALPSSTIAYVILFDEIMVVSGLVGALVKSTYKWGFFAFGTAAFFFVAYTLVADGYAHARALGPDVKRTYLMCGVWTIFLWCLYPLAWGLCEGGNVIPPDSEAIFYGILDLLSKVGFGALLLWGHRNIDITRLGIRIREPGDIVAHNDKEEKHGDSAGPATNGASTA